MFVSCFGHVFDLRIVYDLKRWLRVGALVEDLTEVEIPLRINTEGDDVTRKKQMTERNKYRSVQSVFSRLTSELTDLSDDKFTAALAQSEVWWGSLRHGNVSFPQHSTQGVSRPDSDLPATQVAGLGIRGQDEDKDDVVHDTNDADESSISADEIPAGRKHATRTARTAKMAPQQSTERVVKLGMNPFNPRTPKSGRPRKNRAAHGAQRSADRKQYNKGAKLRAALRGDDVAHVEEFLNSKRPSLRELFSYSDTFEIRYRGHKNTKMALAKRVPDKICVPYRLPESIMRMTLDSIERTIPFGDTMDLSTQPDASAECWVVTIKGVGEFTQRQLMAMQYVWTMATACTNGMKCYSWLMSKVDTPFDDEKAAALAQKMLEAWPGERLCGFGDGFHMEWSHLFCARDKLLVPRQLHSSIYDNTCGKVLQQHYALPSAAGTDKDLVFMPLNIDGSHWVLDKRSYHNFLEELAEELVKKSLPRPYTIITVHSPVQKDGDNCGPFVCLYFWRRVFKEAGNDYLETGLLRRRWDLLRNIVEFSDSSKNSD
ncbi:hypothetical protein PHYPSEUDO_001291 [Phytophthora pseudosyringae]|uniref:Ubiquitin-like protease family profile domain-containing protein n=1 Tax=Phytophthora pseudosyringae TaxID=221518 RepID=A0A8T1VX63_9STRA|nr:hypothetical protein PHYPSEUDO_001291 [Phytophthora pseudosyringae]